MTVYRESVNTARPPQDPPVSFAESSLGRRDLEGFFTANSHCVRQRAWLRSRIVQVTAFVMLSAAASPDYAAESFKPEMKWIVLERAMFELKAQQSGPDPRLGTTYTYLASGSQILDVFVSPIDPTAAPDGLSILDREVSRFLSAIQELKRRRIYEQADAEPPTRVRFAGGDTAYEGRRIVLAIRRDQRDLRSFYLVSAVRTNVVVFRFTAPAKDFRERELDEFAAAWLSGFVGKAESMSREPVLQGAAPPGSLGRTTGVNDTQTVITINPALLRDERLGAALLAHELTHAAYPHEEDWDREIRKLVTAHGIVLADADYKLWGKSELLADLTALEVLAEMCNLPASENYARLRGLREELTAQFRARCKAPEAAGRK